MGAVVSIRRGDEAALRDAMTAAELAWAHARLARKRAELETSKALSRIKATMPPGTPIEAVVREYLRLAEQVIDEAGT